MRRGDDVAPNRVAVVTGGASGMGEAICHALRGTRTRVVVLDIDDHGAQRVAENLREVGAEALAVAADVTERSAVEAAFAKSRKELGPVTILVTSAGLVGFEPFTEISLESWQRIIDVNLTGTFHCCQVAVPDMVAARSGLVS